MQLHNLLKFKTAWAQPPAGDRPVVLSSRVRLARNLADRPFPGTANARTLKDIRQRVFAALREAGAVANAAFLNLEDLEPVDRMLLVERHLVSHDLASRPEGRGLAVGDGEALSLMVNEEDHLRIQGLAPGLKLHELSRTVERLETALAERLPFAAHARWGYLAACPTNTGTGLRASALVHLAATGFLGKTGSVLQEAARQGLVARGLYGEGTQVLGDIIQFATGAAMGRAEDEYVVLLTRFLKWAAVFELRCQDGIKEGAYRMRVEDQIFRSLGVLMYARALSYEELMRHLSLVRLGLSLGLRLGPTLGAVQELFLTAQPSHLQYVHGRELTDSEDLALRAELARSKLNA